MVESILSYIWQAVSAALIQILILLGPGILLALILNFETSLIQNRAVKTLGRGWYLGLFGWLGTIVHELGHAIFCVIFRHKITDIKLFRPDPATGTLGYVKHSYNRANLYHLTGNFFIGIGPILLGMAIIYLFSWWLLGINHHNLSSSFSSVSCQLNSWNSLRELLQALWNSSGYLFTEIFSWKHIASWQLYIFIYLVFAIGTSITLSPSDIKAAMKGFIVIAVLMLVLNLATVWAGNFVSRFIIGISGYYVLFYTIAFLIMLINLAAALLILFPLSILRLSHSRAN